MNFLKKLGGGAVGLVIGTVGTLFFSFATIPVFYYNAYTERPLDGLVDSIFKLVVVYPSSSAISSLYYAIAILFTGPIAGWEKGLKTACKTPYLVMRQILDGQYPPELDFMSTRNQYISPSNNDLIQKIKTAPLSISKLLDQKEITDFKNAAKDKKDEKGEKNMASYEEHVTKSCSFSLTLYQELSEPVTITGNYPEQKDPPQPKRQWTKTYEQEYLITWIKACTEIGRLAFEPATKDLLTDNGYIVINKGLGLPESLIHFVNEVRVSRAALNNSFFATPRSDVNNARTSISSLQPRINGR